MSRNIFNEIDENVVKVIAPSIAEAKDLSDRVRYILTKIGKERGRWRKRNEYKFGDLHFTMKRDFAFNRDYRVFYKDELVLHINDRDKVQRFRDGPWIKELVPLYWKAKLAHLEFAFGIDYIGELCDHFDHNTGYCSIHTETTCPCQDFKYEEGSP